MASIPFIYFTLWLIAHLRRKDMRFGAGAVALLWIDISSFFSVLLDIRNLYGDWGCNDYAISLGGVLLYCLLWTIVLYPLTRLDNKDIRLSVRKQKLFRYLCIFFIVCGAIYIFGSGAYANIIENLQSSRSDAYDSSIDNSSIYSGKRQILLWIPMIVSKSWPLLLLCWFISVSICPQSVWVRFGLLVLSMFLMISGYAGGGRAQIIWWMITFIIYYCLFSPFIEAPKRKIIIGLFGGFTAIGIGGIAAITLSRFDASVAGYAIDSIIGYAGQPLNNFCSLLPYSDSFHLYSDRIFPLTNFLLTHQPYDMKEYYEFLGGIYPIQVNVFFTIFGCILMDIGYIGLLVFLLIYYIITQEICINKTDIEFSHLIVLAILFCFPVRGLFGWPFLGQLTESLGIFFSIGLYIIFKYTFKLKS